MTLPQAWKDRQEGPSVPELTCQRAYKCLHGGAHVGYHGYPQEVVTHSAQGKSMKTSQKRW